MAEKKAQIDKSLPERQRHRWAEEGYATWKGCFKVEQLDRRVDLLVVPYARIAPALIYFTGSGLLCRQMRGKAMKMGMRLNEKALIDVRTGDEIHVKTEQDVFARLEMAYIEPRKRDEVGTGFHFTKADRAKQQEAEELRRQGGAVAGGGGGASAAAGAVASSLSSVPAPSHSQQPLTASTGAAAALVRGATTTSHGQSLISQQPPTGSVSQQQKRRRRIFVIGDQNLMGSEVRCDITERALSSSQCVGALLQRQCSGAKSAELRQRMGEMEVVLKPDGFLEYCEVGLQTPQVVKLLLQQPNAASSDTSALDVASGDVVIVATQLWDNDLRSITTESKRGYDSRDLGRPERMMYDPRTLVEKLKERGASCWVALRCDCIDDREILLAFVVHFPCIVLCCPEPVVGNGWLSKACCCCCCCCSWAAGVLIGYARLTSHPELSYDVAASRQKHKTLENFFVRFEMEKSTRGVCESGLLRHIYIKNGRFTKTGSGQT